MNTHPIPEPNRDQVLIWLHQQLQQFEKALSARESMAKCWKGGTDASWRAAGCKMTRKQRLNTAASHTRIAEKCRLDVIMCRAALKSVGNTPTPSNPEPSAAHPSS